MFGNKENGVTYASFIEVSRTKTVNYQAVKIGVAFHCPPQVNYSTGFQLAEFLVESRINGKYNTADAAKFDAAYAAVFPGDTVQEYLKEFKAIASARRSGFFKLDEK